MQIILNKSNKQYIQLPELGADTRFWAEVPGHAWGTVRVESGLLISAAHSALRTLIASLAFDGGKNLVLYLGSSSVVMVITLTDSKFDRLSLRHLMRLSFSCAAVCVVKVVALLCNMWNNIFIIGMILGPDTHFSSESSTVASWKGPSTHRVSYDVTLVCIEWSYISFYRDKRYSIWLFLLTNSAKHAISAVLGGW